MQNVATTSETDNTEAEPQPRAQELPFAFARKFGALLEPQTAGPDLLFTSGKPTIALLSEVRRFVSRPVDIKILSEEEFENRLADFYQKDSSVARQLMNDIGNDQELHSLAEELPDSEDLLDADDGAPIIRMINAMLGEAIKEGASDIHIETFETALVIRFRIDGVLREILRPQRKLATLLVSRIKVMAKLDIAEKRIPQDGRISLKLGGRAVDVRVSTLPSRHGERIVLRLLDRNSVSMDMASLGMTPAIHQHLQSALRKPHGIILVTGPTGSGKSTTLYAGLMEINSSERNILTVEDPVEFDLEGVGQTQVNPKVDMTFARGLRAILRQDPDVVMVGEIRDLETAEISIQASLTGHLVLSTLHTNTAIGAVTRMRDMGIEPFLLSSSLLGVLAQRLVRTLCSECRVARVPSDGELKLMRFSRDEVTTLYEAREGGCETCNHSGYRGRTGIHELFPVDDEVRRMIHEGASEQAMEKVVRRNSPGIQQDGFSKVIKGVTSIEEVLRVTREE